MKIGRNAPCPCGSGKKYKHCCLKTSADAAPPSEDLLVWRRVRRVLDGVPLRMLKFTSQVYGDVALHEAWAEFHLWAGEDDEEPEFDPSSPLIPLFMAWFFHHWTPDIDTLVEDPSLHDKSPTATFLERPAGRIEPVLRRYLEGCLAAPFSFHEILRAEPGEGFSARDVLTGDERQVIEKSASEHMGPGDILFGQLVEVDGIVMLEAASPVMLPPTDKIEIMDFRRFVAKQTHLATPRERLLELDGEIRDIYLALVSRILQPSLPEMRNTDGELIELQRIVFDIDSADAAFHALKHLCVTQSEDELLASAELGADGRIEHVEINWSKPGNALHARWTNTSLGRIEISGKRLIAEVNSANRGEMLRRIVEDALGEQARYRATEIQSLEGALDDADDTRGRDDASNELAELPEVKARIRQHMAAHYEEWVNAELPALDGRSPSEAVADPEGREKVEALLCEFERGAERMNLHPELLQGVRKRLGLE
jgi:hypothetical protein